MSLPNYHQKEFVIHQNFFQLFTLHQSIKIHCSAHLSHLQRSSHTAWNALKSNTLIHLTLQHILFNNHATQPKKHTCHHVLKQCFHFMTPENDPNFHLTMLHENPIHVTVLHWNFTNLVFIQSKLHASSLMMQIPHKNNI